MRAVVITGVSTGIGRGIASVLVKDGWQVFGTVRNSRDADALKMELGNAFVPVMLDVRDEASLQAAAEAVRKELGGRHLDGLVNNAGVAVSGPLLLQPTEEFRQQIDINLLGPFLVTKAFAPLLLPASEHGGTPGRIINISSVGGRIGPPFLGAYAASKHGIEGMSESLRRELIGLGIDVILVGPGSVATPIWEKADGAMPDYIAKSPWRDAFAAFGEHMIREGREGYPPEKIGMTVRHALLARRPRVRYAVVPGAFVNWTLPNILPRRLIDRLLGRQFGLSKISRAKPAE